MTVELKFGGLSRETALALLSSAAAVKASENGKAQMVPEGDIYPSLPEALTEVSVPAQPEASPAITTEQVRAVLADKSRAGKAAEDYAAYISELITDAKKRCGDPIVLVEQRLDFSEYVPDGFGTGDCVAVADGTLEIDCGFQVWKGRGGIRRQ